VTKAWLPFRCIQQLPHLNHGGLQIATPSSPSRMRLRILLHHHLRSTLTTIKIPSLCHYFRQHGGHPSKSSGLFQILGKRPDRLRTPSRPPHSLRSSHTTINTKTSRTCRWRTSWSAEGTGNHRRTCFPCSTRKRPTRKMAIRLRVDDTENTTV
jgi:hypothetical protein